MMFITTIQNKLALTNEQSEEFLLASQQKFLREEDSNSFSNDA